MSHSEAKPGVVVIATWRSTGAARTRAVASRSRSRLSTTARCSTRAGLGQRQRPMAALEQQHAEAGFELLDLPAHRRLREEHLGRRLREAQRARGRLEAAQQLQRRQFDRRRRGFRILWMHATSSE